MPFPVLFPGEGLAHIIGHLRGDPNHNLRCAAEGAYDLLGFALSQVVPGAPQVFLESANDAELADSLEKAFRVQGEVGADLKLPPWLVDTLLALLRKWLIG